MRDLNVLMAALEVVEEKIEEPLSAEALAQSCFSSYSGLNKLFQYAFGRSVGEYITKRRLSLAARMLIESDESIIDIALKYQYGSPEAFSRAFKRFFGQPPSEFRSNRRFYQLQPKFNIKTEGGFFMANRKPMDVSDLYETLKKQAGTYALCVDIIEFKQVNDNYGHDAGDRVLAEVFAKLDAALEQDMLLFRVGGDEFVIATGYTNPNEAMALAEKITAFNGESVNHKGVDIPFYLRVGIAPTPKEQLKYKDALEILYKSMHMARVNNETVSLLKE